MRRFPFDILFALLFGLGLGLAYSWLISPLRIIDADPIALRADFKDQYRAAIAASFSATNNLPRAESRLALLGDSNSVEALNSQAQRTIASGASGDFTQADQLAALALALENGYVQFPVPVTTSENILIPDIDPTSTVPPSPEELPFQFTETPQSMETPIIETSPAVFTSTPRPTRTAIPTVGVPFALIAQDTVCDTNLPDGLLQVIVFNTSRRQVAGAKIIIAWDAGEENFFTGLKSEIGNGYADFIMTPNVTYSLRLAVGSDVVSELSAPTCQTPSGETFLGGIKLTFQQP
jgi:hypothetical protein